MDIESMKSDKDHVTVHWFRHGLRIHDNPALLAGLEDCQEFYPIFIFDGEVAGTKDAAFPRMRFLLETLEDLDKNLRAYGTCLYVLHGNPTEVLERLISEWGVTRITFEQDPEPIWQKRDNEVKSMCDKNGVEWIEKVSHMLWDPQVVIGKNGGQPPLTYTMFCQVVELIGPPEQPVKNPCFDGIQLPLKENHDKLYGLPALNDLEVFPETEAQQCPHGRYLGGETKALKLLEARLQKEKEAFQKGRCLPNQLYPDLTGMPLSLSPHLRFGSLSIRKLYWSIVHTYLQVNPKSNVPSSITSQLIWREYFYCMSVNNPHYNQMKDNPICLNIDWYKDENVFDKWKKGLTGYPWIDACMRQLIQEGWIHHVCRNATACFLTRGDLWIDWQLGLEVFNRYLLDADWSVCAGNWMWVSSSAFEKVFQCPRCICPVRYGKRLDPSGSYVRRYVPEVRNLPLEYLFEPWKAPRKVQEEANCIIGEDYPEPMVEHKSASKECKAKMEKIKNFSKNIPHIGPENEAEVMSFMMYLAKDEAEEMIGVCNHNGDALI